MNAPEYSIVVPAYNESERIGASLEKILSFLTLQNWDAEIVVVDDGSRDQTAAIVRQHGKKDARVRLLQNPGNRGKGYSVRNGMLHAGGGVAHFQRRRFVLAD